MITEMSQSKMPVFAVGGTVSVSNYPCMSSTDTEKVETKCNHLRSQFAQELNKTLEVQSQSLYEQIDIVKVVNSDNLKSDLTRLKMENEELRLKIKDCQLEDRTYTYLRQELNLLTQKVSKLQSSSQGYMDTTNQLTSLLSLVSTIMHFSNRRQDIQALGVDSSDKKISDKWEENYIKNRLDTEEETYMTRLSGTRRRRSEPKEAKAELKNKSKQTNRRMKHHSFLTRSHSCSGQQYFLLQSTGTAYDGLQKYNKIKRSKSTVFDPQKNFNSFDGNKRVEEDSKNFPENKKISLNSKTVGGKALRRIKTFLRRSGKYECKAIHSQSLYLKKI